MENKGIKILGIDDNKDNLVILKALVLETFPDATLYMALSGEEGLRSAYAEDPDVILLDIVMPVMSGYEVCKRLKADKKLSNIPVVFLTALKEDKDSRVLALYAGAEGFLSKPIDKSELTAQIRAMLKVKQANFEKLEEKDRLEILVAERTKELVKSEERYHDLLENLETGIVVHLPDTSIVMNNLRASQLLGLTDDQMRGKVAIDPAWKFVNEDNKPLPLDSYPVNRIITGGKPIKNQILGIHQSGNSEVVWVTVNGFPVLDNTGEITEIVISFINITERKQAEEVTKKEQALSNAIIDSIPGTFYMLDETGKYVRWNAYQRDEIVGKPDDMVGSTNAMDTIHPDDRGLIQMKIANVLANGADEMVEGRVLLRGGPAFRWLLMTGHRMLIDGHPFLVGTGIDITESKNNQIELQKYRDSLEVLVKQRTEELEKKNAELQKFNKLFVDREFRIKELKDRIKELEAKG